MYLRPYVLALIATTVLTAGMAAQTASDSPSPSIAGAALLPPKGGMITMRVDGADDAAPVKGAPFCATITTEHTQSFADGNRIHTTDTSTSCRDSDGRTRREAGLRLLGAGPQNSAPKLIAIVDPVAGVRYMLDSENKVAHKMVWAAQSNPGFGPADLPDKGERMFIYRNAGGAGPQTFSTNVFFRRKIGQDSSEPTPSTENLGDQMIDGIHASGTRMTTTIPSGQMGNDKPISVISERWYSADLKATVMTKHSDPWAGELKTEFTSVNTSEPDPSLFMVPSDYRIVDDKTGPITIQMPPPAPPTQ
ncbi:MAG: hypothetical protein WCC24_02240 [Terracidiphilus sp.]